MSRCHSGHVYGRRTGVSPARRSGPASANSVPDILEKISLTLTNFKHHLKTILAHSALPLSINGTAK